MNIGIIIALKEEFDITGQGLKFKKKQYLNKTIYKFKYEKNNLYLIYSGVGKANAALATSILIGKYKVNNIINIGSTGSISKNLNVGDIALINNIYNFDVDLTFFGYKIGQMSKEPEFYKWDGEFIMKKIPELKLSNIASGDSFITKSNINNYEILNKNQVSCVDMELASIAQICNQNDIGLCSIKIISDSIFDKKCNWEEEVKIIKDRIFNLLMRVVDAIIYR